MFRAAVTTILAGQMTVLTACVVTYLWYDLPLANTTVHTPLWHTVFSAVPECLHKSYNIRATI